jgi:hypothetical protein
MALSRNLIPGSRHVLLFRIGSWRWQAGYLRATQVDVLCTSDEDQAGVLIGSTVGKKSEYPDLTTAFLSASGYFLGLESLIVILLTTSFTPLTSRVTLVAISFPAPLLVFPVNVTTPLFVLTPVSKALVE